MKKLNAFLVSVLATAALNAAVIEQVIVRQQWPWSTDVKIEYKISAVTNPVDIAIQAFNGVTELALPAEAITGDRYGIAEDGVGTLVIDPVKAFGTAKVALANFKVKLAVADSQENIGEVLYKIFDLTTGACEDVTRGALLNGRYGTIETNYGKIGDGFTTTLGDVVIWTGVTNDVAYKTSKLVMRKINAQGKIWQSGDPAGASVPGDSYSKQTQYWDKFTYDYYIAVFETTLAQYELINGSRPSGCATASGDTEGISAANSFPYTGALGDPAATSADKMGYVTGEAVIFPNNTYVRDVAKNSLAGKLWAKTQAAGKCYEFTLPTVAEWEYACMGGNTSALYSGFNNYPEAHVKEVSWYKDNANGVHEVGELRPNAYGLYDMLGNVAELVCGNGGLNEGGESGSGATYDDPVVNPLGTTTLYPFNCGGCWSNDCNNYGTFKAQRHAGRHNTWIGKYDSRQYIGCRFVIPARVDGQWADHPAN